MAGESVAQRPQCGHQFVTRPLVGRQQQFVEWQRLRIHDEVVVRLEQLRNQRRSATCNVEDEAGRCGARGGLADVFPGDVDERFRCRDPRDGFLHEGVPEFPGADVAQRKVQAFSAQDRARRQPSSLVFQASGDTRGSWTATDRQC